MTAKEAERLVHRRVRVLALVRTEGRGTSALRVQITCTEAEGGGWAAFAVAHAGDERVVHEWAQADDPTAALLALPGVLAAKIEAVREQLLAGLREGEDRPDPEPEAPVRASSRRKGGP